MIPWLADLKERALALALMPVGFVVGVCWVVVTLFVLAATLFGFAGRWVAALLSLE